MAKRTKNYYAVVRGRVAPVICTSWGITGPLVNGYNNSKFKGFQKFSEAALFMEENGHSNYRFIRGITEGERAPRKGERAYYAVANGENNGVYDSYEGGAKEEITRYPNSCHKAFKSRDGAKGYIKENRVVVDVLKQESPDVDRAAIICDLLSQITLEQ